MTRVALTKLAILVLLAFIICLPDFFAINKVLRVSLHRMRPLLCAEEESREQTGDKWSSSTCSEHCEQMRAAADQMKTSQMDGNYFVCQTDVNMAGLGHNISSPDETVLFEVSLTLQESNITSANITLFGHYNYSFQYVYFSDEGEKGEKTNEPSKSFLYCPPSVDTAANHSCCLLWLSVQLSARLPWKHIPKDEGRCVLWVVWLSLVGVVLLLIAIAVSRITKGRRRCSDNAKSRHFNYTDDGYHLNDNKKHQEVHFAIAFDKMSPFSWSVLSSIEEEDTPDENDVFYNDNMDEDYNDLVRA